MQKGELLLALLEGAISQPNVAQLHGGLATRAPLGHMTQEPGLKVQLRTVRTRRDRTYRQVFSLLRQLPHLVGCRIRLPFRKIRAVHPAEYRMHRPRGLELQALLSLNPN